MPVPEYTNRAQPNAQGSAAHDQEQLERDRMFLYRNGVAQPLILSKIPYYDQNNNRKFIPVAVYEKLNATLPLTLPTLLPPPANLAYRICNVGSKGMGIVATRNIAEGEIVIVERPVFVFPRTMIPPDGFQSFEEHAKGIIDPEDLQKYNDLKNVSDSTDVPSNFLGIALTNGFDIELKRGKESYCGVFLEMSRINHSCSPNLVRSWNPYLFAFSVRAARPIRVNEEFTIAYEEVAYTHANRRQALEKRYKFQCKCGHCTNTSPISDEDRAIRQTMIMSIAYRFKFEELVHPRFTRSERRTMAEVYREYLIRDMAWFKKEGTESMSLMFHYLFLMKTYGLLGNVEWFRKWGFKAVLASVRFTDEEGRAGRLHVGEWIDWIKEPYTYPGWGMLQL